MAKRSEPPPNRSDMILVPSASKSPTPCRAAILPTSSTTRSASTESEIETAGLFLGEDRPFITLQGEGDGGAGADRVKAIVVAAVVGHGNGLQVGHSTQGAEHNDGLVFRAFAPLAGPLALADLRAPAAGDGQAKHRTPSTNTLSVRACALTCSI